MEMSVEEMMLWVAFGAYVGVAYMMVLAFWHTSCASNRERKMSSRWWWWW